MIRKAIALILALALLLPFGSALAVNYYRVNTSWLKAHDKPDYNATVVDSYRRDFAVTIAQTYKDGWAKVRFRPGGAAVFVQTKYLKLCSSYSAYVNQDDTVLLSGPATSFKSNGKLSKGAKVTVLTHGSAFDYVSSAKGKGYIRNTHLTSKKPSKTTAYIKNYEGKKVWLRKGPGTKYKTLGSYPTGTKVKLLKYGKTWCKVSVGGKTGYMKTIFIRQK
jgi:uncharacterized protein YgiM (DUF1202 family)